MRVQNYIGGRFADAVDGSTLDKIQPSTGQVYATLPDSKGEDVDRAVQAAKTAFPGWSATPEEARAKVLNRIADLLEQRLEAFAVAESTDQGKTVATARTVDIPRAIHNFRYYAGFILHREEMSTVLDSARVVNWTARKPFGVVGLISPWNLPLYLATWKIAPAIAFGNTCVLKPSELTPMTVYMLCSVFADAGLPAGVVNVVHGLGDRVGQPLVEHRHVPIISFTGGTVTGKRIAVAAAPKLKKLSLELGGKNANIIFADCDLDDCVSTTLRTSFANQGEICLCGSRILVQSSIYDTFMSKFVAAAKALRTGDPQDPQSFMGALISKQHLEKVRGYIEVARQEGGTVLLGGDAPSSLPSHCQNGYFLNPTIITGLGPNSRCNQEEIFGPVVTVIPFESEQEAIEIANGTAYGLSASIWTRDVARANRVSLALDTGYVWINCWLVRDLRCPFGGVKSSGLGREGGKFALDFYTEVKTVSSKY